jgi:hypothetical protein
MTVSTVSSSDVVYVNGKPKLVANINKADRGGRGGRGGGYSNRNRCRAQQLQPRYDLISMGQPLAFDCEGVKLPRTDGKDKRGVGRISVVNASLELVYDTFVYYADRDHRPDPQHLKMGITYEDIKPVNGAQRYQDVIDTLKAIFDQSGVLVAHDFLSDSRMLDDLDFSAYDVKDTQHVSEYRELNDWNPPALVMLASNVLGRNLDRTDGHSSIDDARVTMELWLIHAEALREARGEGTRVQPTRTCKQVRTGLAPGSLVALPGIPGACPPDHEWDPKSSTYVPKVYTPEEGVTFIPYWRLAEI